MAKFPVRTLLVAILGSTLDTTKCQAEVETHQDISSLERVNDNDGPRRIGNIYWSSLSTDVSHDNTRASGKNRWLPGESNCTCNREMTSLKTDLREEVNII
ncbi:hypothetical protein PoB_006407600 [Plakobranchus ocellatus]|uniref:Uncharacterized protein n=1 Tax=Plakobranchus ocellatus TaxID=259542 RepID=A0AAV4D035_9GAST|nr:hypothetical protein PoB_006407600 [Plakobranchus ocellatus]